jgi:hypothetical protein
MVGGEAFFTIQLEEDVLAIYLAAIGSDAA